MNNLSVYNSLSRFCSSLFILFFILFPLRTSALVQDPIVLKVEPLPFTPSEFYIEALIDEREDRSAVAWLIPPGSGRDKTQAIDLAGGGKSAVENFVLQSLPRNEDLRPILIRLKKFNLVETFGENGLVNGELKLEMSFDLQGEKANHRLVDFNGGMRYRRSSSTPVDVEPRLRKSLENALVYLQQWIEKNSASHVLLARDVEVVFSDYAENSDNDTVFYSPDRPLVWDDFQALPKPGKYSASVFPSFSWTGRSEVIDGVVHFHVQTKVYMLKSSSWVRQSEKNTYGLNHEQRHFDLVKIVVERFKQKLMNRRLTPEAYDDRLGYLYIETYREMNQLQDKYDSETRHGLNKQAQEKWNRWIDGELNQIFSK